jgi:hypothetical protein
MDPITRKSYAAGHFELLIDGDRPTAYVRSIEGGWSNAVISDDAVGPDATHVKQISNVEIEPITVEFGLGGACDLLAWIAGSWDRTDKRRRTGQITHADFDMRTMFEHDFYDAVLTDTTFPALDGSSREAGYLTCKLQPGWVETRALPTPGPQISGNQSPSQKKWTPAAFRIRVDGIEDMKYVNHLDSFTVTTQLKKLPTGPSRFPQLVPINTKFPNLTGTLALANASKLLQWHKDYIGSKEGTFRPDPAAQLSGAIEYLAPDRDQVLFRIKLTEVGLVSLRVAPSKANEEQIKRVKFELYVHKMEIDRSCLRNLL